ncbi:glucokinase [Sphingobium olei]|uniref:Glucokinase n=1 Tax=Sphingobium olei TaxID=420955 RepID=A0ABW3P1J5_9SPHN
MGQSSSAILACVGSEGVDFALPSAAPGEVHGLQHINANDCPTFTDALMRYASQARLSLRDTKLFMSIAGAVNGTTVRTTNGRWFISLSGLSAVTGGEPVILNDVAATAWATADRPRALPFGGPSDQTRSHKGRHAIISAWRGGLGAACVDRHDGFLKIVESEAGHTPFAVQDEDDWAMAKACIVRHGTASYEHILFDLMDGRTLHRPIAGHELDEKFAVLLGRYSAEVTLTFTAWDGIYLCGSVFDTVAKRSLSATFRAAFEGKGKLRQLLQQTPSQLFQLRNGSLSGLSILYSRTRTD